MKPITRKIIRIDETTTPPTVYVKTEKEGYDRIEVLSIDDIDIRGRDSEGNLIVHTED